MSETLNKNDDIRGVVAEAYAKAVSQPAPESCCGKPEQKGVAVKAAGYSSEELEALPSDAVVNSFGCGNPLAFSGVQAGETVVDLGAGAGIDLLIAAKKVGPTGRVIGIVMTDEMTDKANEHIAASGFENVEERVISAPLRMASAAECRRWRQETSGTLQQMLIGVGEEDRRMIWAEVEEEFRKFEGPEGFESPCELLVCSGRKRPT